jgi:tRNA N6-adenosine threonylcarbamoyltransferase
MLILGIETSCDETSAAVVRDGRQVLSNIVASQDEVHSPFGGVVPELACRRHTEVIDDVVFTAIEQAGAQKSDIDLIAVVNGPGLIGALLIGLTFGKGLAYSLKLPLVPVHHIEAHLYASLMCNENIPMPAIGLVVSGGHTVLFQMNSVGDYKLLGSTVDDAVGEAFDKVAALLGLPYLGGPLVEKLALEGDRNAIEFPRAMMKKGGFDFSYSGLKTAVLYRIKGYGKTRHEIDRIDEREKADIAAGFQEAALDVLVKKSINAAEKCGTKTIVIGGGVSRNQRLRDMFQQAGEKRSVTAYFPTPRLCTDNAAMVAGLAYHKYKQHPSTADLTIDAHSNLQFINS